MEPAKGALAVALLSLVGCDAPSAINMHGSMTCYPVKVAESSIFMSGRTSTFISPAITNEPPTKDTPVGQIAYHCDWWSQ